MEHCTVESYPIQYMNYSVNHEQFMERLECHLDDRVGVEPHTWVAF